MSCPDCFRGHDHPGPVNGFETELHAHKVYVTEPPERERGGVKGLIVILTDAFGWNTVNIRRVADSYARRTGCRVYIPDFMYGKPTAPRSSHPSYNAHQADSRTTGTAAPPSMKSVMDRLVSERGIWGWLAKPCVPPRQLPPRSKPLSSLFLTAVQIPARPLPLLLRPLHPPQQAPQAPPRHQAVPCRPARHSARTPAHWRRRLLLGRLRRHAPGARRRARGRGVHGAPERAEGAGGH